MGREWCEVEGDPDVRVLPGQTYSLVVESPSDEACWTRHQTSKVFSRDGGQGGFKCAQFHTVCPFAKFASVQYGNEPYDICVEQISYHVSLVSFLLKAFSSEGTSFSYNPAHSDIVDASNMEAMKKFLDATGATANPVAWC